jgi:hypothetical protein
MEAVSFSETLVTIYQTTQCHIAEDGNLHSQLLGFRTLSVVLYSKKKKKSKTPVILSVIVGAY